MEGAVLVIEDYPPIAKALCVLATACGLASVVAQNAADARALISDDWTGVIADVFLPDGNGVDLLALGRRTRTWPALVLTGNDSRGVANRAFELDASYLLKPIEAKRIIKWLRRARDAFEEQLVRALEAWQARYSLTVAELEVLELAARGRTHDQIALERHVSPLTLKNVVKSMLRKTDDDTLAHAALRLVRGA